MLKLKTLLSEKTTILLSIMLGVNFSFYFSIYVKTDLIPLGSTRFHFLTFCLIALGSFIYFIALLWLKKQLSTFSRKNIFKAGLFSFLLGPLLFFATTSQWQEEGFYIQSVLPISYELFLPWYASRGAAFFVGGIFFASIAFALFVLLLSKEIEVIKELKEKIHHISFSIVEDKKWLTIFALVLFAFILRAINLEALPPHLEEYSHLNAAKDLLAGVPKEFVYQRSFYMVTLPVKFFFSIFGTEVWVARIPGILVNSLAIIPLFFLTRKINTPVALLSSILYATNPWVIALSRAVREYAFYPIFFYFILLGFLYLLENIPRGFVITELKPIFTKKILGIISLLFLAIIFALVVDPRSTFKAIAFMYLVFLVFLALRFDMKNSKNILFLLLGIGFIAISILILQTLPILGFRDHLEVAEPFRNLFNGNTINLLGQFFFNPPVQWYYDRILLVPVISLLFAFGWGFLVQKKNNIPVFLSALYIFSIILFIFFYDFTYAPRFFLHIQLWYIPLLAMGIYGWYRITKMFFLNKKMRYGFILLILLSIFNLKQIFIHTDSKELPVTSAIHMGFDGLDDYLIKNGSPQDVLVSKYYGRYAKFYNSPEFAMIYEASFSEEAIKENPGGWMVLDTSRQWAYEKELPLESFYLGDTLVEFIGEFPDPVSRLGNYLWHWSSVK
ncbi:MAG: hypothetical protein HN560_16185 [Anaerolineae bacterium]|jgi:hypothetical protein|nr:hypothetical protein [Anaerolineae bacterium]MBT7602589.1 hypothetical protein [Anaerolineae bacterium]MBT7990619.1 hypothetical protein [Anaerolineae bacterium]